MNERIAALPMYDLPELRDANDAFWDVLAARLRARGAAAPMALTRGKDLEAIWTGPDLLMAQTCGLPLVTVLRDKVQLVATPRYRAAGCEGALYRSAIVVRAGDNAAGLADLRGRRAAVNELNSNSGMNALRTAVAPLACGARFFGDVVWTGGHVGSVAAVIEEQADVAAIDCVTWAHLRHFRPAVTDGLRVLDWSTATPGLPLITSLGTDARTLAALLRALDDVAGDDVCEPLLIEGFERLPLGAYDVIEGSKEAVLF